MGRRRKSAFLGNPRKRRGGRGDQFLTPVERGRGMDGKLQTEHFEFSKKVLQNFFQPSEKRDKGREQLHFFYISVKRVDLAIGTGTNNICSPVAEAATLVTKCTFPLLSGQLTQAKQPPDIYSIYNLEVTVQIFWQKIIFALILELFIDS